MEAVMMREDHSRALRQALESLYTVREKLNSAKKWGILDIFGGSMISTYMKHSRINEVEGMIEQARIRLTDFQKALRKVEVSPKLQTEISGFLTFADFAFDNPITDYLVQTKLQSLGEEVEDTIQLTEELLAHIRTQ